MPKPNKPTPKNKLPTWVKWLGPSLIGGAAIITTAIIAGVFSIQNNSPEVPPAPTDVSPTPVASVDIPRTESTDHVEKTVADVAKELRAIDEFLARGVATDSTFSALTEIIRRLDAKGHERNSDETMALGAAFRINGRAHQSKKDWINAIQSYTDCIKLLKPPWSEQRQKYHWELPLAYRERGNSRAKSTEGSYAEAIDDITTALDLFIEDEKKHLCHLYLAEIYVEVGDSEKAAEHASIAAKYMVETNQSVPEASSDEPPYMALIRDELEKLRAE